MTVPRIKKNDMVIAIAGNDASQGKTGKVLQIVQSGKRAVVEGMKTIKKTMRKSQDNPQGSIVEKESPVAISNLLLYCPECKKGVRIGRGRDGDRSVRRCRKCEHSFDG